MGLDMFVIADPEGKPCLEDFWDTENPSWYWRKTNAVHKFFVDKVQGGVDDCGVYEIPVSVLDDLLEKTTSIVRSKSPTLAEEILPTKQGFFFGDYYYDKKYFSDLEYTARNVEEMKDLLLQHPNAKFYYTSSW